MNQGELNFGGELPESAVIRCPGARAALDQLLDEVLAASVASAGDLSSLAKPLRIIVPSSSLREQVAAALTQHARGSLLGVSIHTLHGAANAILGAALSAEMMERPARGAALFPVLCRREAAEASALREVLMELEDGLGEVVGSVADLLDAGFEPALEEALVELCDERTKGAGVGRSALRRAHALLGVASRVAAEMDAIDVERTGGLLRRAGEALREDPAALFPSSKLWIFGFADLTGVAADFLENLRRACGGRVLVDLPPDPTRPECPDPGVAFLARLLERFGDAGTADCDVPVDSAPHLEAVEAEGTEAEVFEVSQRVRSLLADGVAPEQIGVVARQLDPYAAALRRVFLREGIPFHAGGAKSSMGEAGRFLANLARSFREREALRVESWLDLFCVPPGVVIGGTAEELRAIRASRRAVLLASAHELGAGRVQQLVALHRDAGSPPKPKLSVGLVQREESKGVAWRVDRPCATSDEWRALGQAARRYTSIWEDWPERARWCVHRDRIDALLCSELGWSEPVGTPAASAFEVLDRLDAALPDDFELSLHETGSLLDHELMEREAELRTPLGGEGGGVQVRSVTEARAHRFEHLFLLGMNREVFPRTITEDPLLPDWIRGTLGPVLPDLSPKGRGVDEERYLFAELLSSSPAVTLLWQTRDEEGKERAPSPFVIRLQVAGVLGKAKKARSFEMEALAAPAQLPPCSADAAVCIAGLYGDRALWQSALGPALDEAAPILDGEPAKNGTALGLVRRAILDEIDPDLRLDSGRSLDVKTGPFFGFIGPTERDDPRRNPLFITTLERVARCPWQALVANLLGVGPAPDALQGLAAVDALVVGGLVHEVLEAVSQFGLGHEENSPLGGRAEEAAQPQLAELRRSPPVALRWPLGAELERILRGKAVRAAEKLGVPSWASLLVHRARPLLARAEALAWPGGEETPRCHGAEIEGELRFTFGDAPGDEADRAAAQTIYFRADRVDERVGEAGGFRLIDFKSGKSFSEAVKPDTRRKYLRERIAAGTHLQGAAYAFAFEGSEGAYVFLDPAGKPEYATAVVPADAEIEEVLRRSVHTLWTGLHAGSLFPRLFDEKKKGSSICDYCEIEPACMRGDSGMKRRLASLVDDGPLQIDEAPTGSAESEALWAFDSLWHIGKRVEDEVPALWLVPERDEVGR